MADRVVMYNITEGTSATAGNELGIFQTGDVYSQEDLDLFFSTLARYADNANKLSILQH